MANNFPSLFVTNTIIFILSFLVVELMIQETKILSRQRSIFSHALLFSSPVKRNQQRHRISSLSFHQKDSFFQNHHAANRNLIFLKSISTDVMSQPQKSSSSKDNNDVELLANLKNNIISIEQSEDYGLIVVQLDENSNDDSSDDYMGKAVSISTKDNDMEGIVVLQRSPLIFIFFSKTSKDSHISKDHLEIKLLHRKQKVTSSSSQNDFPSLLSEKSSATVPVYSKLPQVSEIQLINQPLLTGLTSIDVLCSLGFGQNMLLIENSAIYKQVLEDIFQSQHDMNLFYCSTNQDFSINSTNVKLLQTKEKDAVLHAAESICLSLSTCSIAETLARSNKDCLVVIDSIQPFKTFWDYTTQTLIDNFGEENIALENHGDSSEMRSFFSNIIQRACNLKQNGSITLLFVVSLPQEEQDKEYTLEDFNGVAPKLMERLTTLQKSKIPLTSKTLSKLQIPVPASQNTKQYRFIDDLISMTDGQIYLQPHVNQIPQDTYPPMDPTKSLTRIGIGADTNSHADAKAFQKLNLGSLRFDLMYALMDTAFDNDKQRIRRDAYGLVMNQKQGDVRSCSQSCIVLLAVKLGYFDGVTDPTVVGELLEFVQKHMEGGGLLEYVDTNKDFTDDGVYLLKEAIDMFFTK